jgi:uncharacterized protein YcbX
MATSTIVGSVARLSRFPVKSMRGERIEEAGSRRAVSRVTVPTRSSTQTQARW